ncbi:MAG: COG2426 family protein [Candidatus Bipolaricaulia bacterium]
MIYDALAVILVSALPISELRGGIPLAIVHYDMTPISAYLLGITGNLIPVVLLLCYLERTAAWLSRSPAFDRFLHWLFSYTRRRHQMKVARWGALALVVLVAIPLPATGAWTGSLVAFVFGVEFRYAFPLITLGVLIAGGIVTLSSVGILAIRLP